MSKRKKSNTTRIDEVDRTMYTTFCSSANSLSQLYTQAMNQQKISFQIGERHGLEKLYQWVLRQQEEGSRMTTVDILAYLQLKTFPIFVQNELDCGGEEPPTSPRLPFQHQSSQPTMNFMNSSAPFSSASFGPTTAGQGPRSVHSEHQTKDSVFSNALSSPVRQSLQNYHLGEGGYCSNNIMSSGNGAQSNETNFPQHQNRDSNSLSCNDSSMDMHADSPRHESPY
ncbi:hypothetical protein HHK36_030576 [Tetracentron sinense]|uniref:Holocarboxylase synthetase n=1 Tax=Tetracentron sinense TaxID=13715 RepID=A0A835D1P3_TETSI|nr:hypothetical protein HHK36_030576 [Tetracentron sinense]